MTPHRMILNEFGDNDTQALASGRNELLGQLVRADLDPRDAVGIPDVTIAGRCLASCNP
jgi:hypothetical protein